MPVTDEDIIRDLLHRYAEDTSPAPSIASGVIDRQRRRDRRRRAGSVAGAGAVLGTAAGVVIASLPAGRQDRDRPVQTPGGGRPPAITLTAAQRVLYRLSTAAARQPLARGRYVVFSEKEDGNLDTTVIDSRTGDTWSYQKGFHGAPSGAARMQRHWSPTAAQFAAMPLGPAALRQALIARYDQQWRQDQKLVNALHRRHASGAGPAPVPRAGLKPPGTPDDQVFEQATDLLWNPLVPPALRAALFRVLAGTPGVTVNTAAHDRAGRPAVEIRRTDRAAKIIYSAFENPRTGAVLELTETSTPGAGPGTAAADGYDLALSVTWASRVPPDPYGR